MFAAFGPGNRVNSSFSMVVAAAVGFSAFGCSGNSQGPERGAASGIVTLDGRPLESGTIMFIPTKGNTGPTAGGTIENGSYSISAENGPPLGKARIEIRSPRKTGKKVEIGPPSPPGSLEDETVEAVPSKYNSQSELVENISVGSNTLDFELTTQ